jgi:hypothetical protein
MANLMKKDKLKHLIVGINGEVGTGLLKVLCKKTNVWGIDKKEFPPYPDSFDLMHICIPYYKANHFEYCVKEYQKRFKPKLTIVHSTVPLGTCDKLKVIHSPIRGVHPSLDKGIKTFVKYFGGKDAMKAALMFKKYGCLVLSTSKTRDTEALKILDTTYYGWNIIFMKEVYRYCKKNKLNFELVYRHANWSYNMGYRKLGRGEVVRPYLIYIKGPIGGHCVGNNLELIKDFDPARIIKNKNKSY